MFKSILMIIDYKIPQSIFSLVRKAFSFEQGSLILLSIFPTIGLKKILTLIIEGVTLKSLILPLLAFGVLTILYTVISLVDFKTGISASKREHIFSTGSPRGYIKSDKLWSSVWKFAGVLIIGSILTIFSMIFALASMDNFNKIFLMACILFYLVVISFDIHSIGENQYRRYGTKPLFYHFIDDVAKAIRDGIIKNIGKMISRLFGNQ